MKTYIIAFFSTLIPLALIDGVWLSTMAKRFYGVYLSHLMAASPKLIPAVIFYIIYTLVLTVFVVLPGAQNTTSLFKVFIFGILFGLVAYGTYDLTNHATLKDWPLIVTVVDLIWGSLLTGLVSVIGVKLSQYFL